MCNFLFFILSIVFVLVSCATPGETQRFSCKDEKGLDVDWFVMYNFPKDSRIPDSGFQYAYLTPSVVNGGWVWGNNLLINQNSTFGRTVVPALDSNVPYTTVYSYNDQRGSKADHYAHTKGFIALKKDLDSHSGFWITHSFPRWSPKKGDAYIFPTTLGARAQLAFCFNLRANNKAESEKLLKVIEDYLITVQPNCNRAACIQSNLSSESLNTDDFTREIEIPGTPFPGMFYKVRHGPNDTEDLYTMTLRERGGGLAHTYCPNITIPVVQNVGMIKFPPFPGNFVFPEWKGNNDHSKWAISGKNTAGDLVCFGDLNRNFKHLKTNGGVICVKHPILRRRFYETISQIDAFDEDEEGDCDCDQDDGECDY